MRLVLDDKNNIPLYQQIVDSLARDIRVGVLPAGYKLPTVRELADQLGASQGTVKHAYDTLERLGLIDKTQGRGTFVCGQDREPAAGKKDQALQAIDQLLDRLQELDFPMRDIRIFLDLKLREREQSFRNVRIGVVDCSPEALSVMCRQISALPHVDVYEYLLQTVLDSPRGFDPGLDILVTTPTHYSEISEKIQPGREMTRLVMALSTGTALELSKLPPTARVGVLCASWRFSRVILSTCEKYCSLDTPPQVALFGQKGVTEGFLDTIDQLILPHQYLQFCSREEQGLIREFTEKAPAIVYRYQVERGSLLFLEEQVLKVYESIKD